MKMMAFGELRFDRKSIPAELHDVASWPGADDVALSSEARDVLQRRIQAMALFVDGHVSLREIGRATGLRFNDLYRLFDRCVTMHEDGRIFGVRALIPYRHTRAYQRSAAVTLSRDGVKGGTSGAFTQLLRRYPEIARWIERKVDERRRKNGGQREVLRGLRRLHRDFLDQCRRAGVEAHDYPFNQQHLGERSLATHVRHLANRHFDAAAQAAGATQIAHAWQDAGEHVRKPAVHPFDVIEFDGHKIDLRVTLRIDDPLGFETLLALHRIWILVLLDVATRAVIGYSLALGREYTKDDIAEALQATLTPHATRAFRIPGLRVRSGGGFPSEVIPETAWACWNTLRFDAAKAHFAQATLERLTGIVGCWADNGPLCEKNERAFIERFFDQLAAHFAHRLPGTTGRAPQAVERALNDVGGNLSLLMSLDELEDVVDVVLADYNGEPHTGLGGRTPLEAMHFLIARESSLVRTLPAARRGTLCLLQEARVVTIRGSVKRGVRPHVNFEYVRYTSSILSSNASLIGQKLRIYFNVKDIRHVHAFFTDGSELGVLTAVRPWCFSQHSLRVRQEIFRLIHQRKITYRDGEDPVEAWFAYKKTEAARHQRSANDLARMLTDRAKSHESPPAIPTRVSPQAQSQLAAEAGPQPRSPRPSIRLTRIFTFS
jgi:prepilin-type processing-associated H-X9-DG protein